MFESITLPQPTDPLRRIAVTVLRWTRYALALDDYLRAFAETLADGPPRFCGRLYRLDALPVSRIYGAPKLTPYQRAKPHDRTADETTKRCIREKVIPKILNRLFRVLLHNVILNTSESLLRSKAQSQQHLGPSSYAFRGISDLVMSIDPYEVRPRKDKPDVDLISDVLAFGSLW